ncbi:ATP-binding cassette domain-containing protein [Hydrogenophaga aromaticivorans]|uniref:ATP-binding cassette domain-containing protein n=1 Tax=Hydrogenophaga aromaticivorans TaxID=2610898 RepID=UPI001B38D216|nr:ATP-binding cassette domain-containing protein [Hydrogenophaga aromaticivorans]MBQ0918508.1 ATP-binding cassette domain-containing protein [Hydrogenophaga aromaticivorans]
MTDTCLLTAQNLHKAYNGKPALKGVNVALQAGEMLALLGPNGAGKSTLLQLLTGLFSPDQGTIVVMGHDMQRHPSRALASLGVVFQQSALDMDLSVMANLLFHTDLHGLPRTVAKQRIADGLAAMGLGDQAKAVVRSLSGGTRRKVELVRALLHEPAVLLMDEATVGLDPASRQHLLDTVRSLCHTRGMAVLWATHLIEEVKVADRLMLLHQGTVRFDGSIDAFMQASQGGDFQTEVLRALQTPGL